MAAPVARVEGLAEFRKELRALGKEWPRQLTKVYKAASATVASKAQSNATALGGMHARAASAIKPYASQTSAGVGVRRSAGAPMALPATWGAKRRTGWYANADKYPKGEGRRQLPPWVGSSWEAGVHGQGPYAINDAVADYADQFVEDLARGLDDLTARAFPNR